jgi:hypothetical protein
MGLPASLSRFRARRASRGPLAAAEERKLRRGAPDADDLAILCAAARLPPDEPEMYCESARQRLARSLPPELANREKLVRGAVNLPEGSGGGIGGRLGGVGTDGGGVSPGAVSSAGEVAGAGAATPSEGSQLGMRGVSPRCPPFAFDVPISAVPPDCAYAMRPLRPP